MSNDLKPVPRVPQGATLSTTAGPLEARSLDAKRDQLCLLVNSRNPIITVETSEEQRFSALLGHVADRLSIPLYCWSVTTGLARAGAAALYNSDQPEQALANIGTVQGDGIFLLKDFARYCDNDKISRKLRDLADGFRTARRSVIILAAALSLPPELSADAVEFQLGLPSSEEATGVGEKSTLAELSAKQGVPNVLDAVGLGQLAKNLTGLSEEEALRVLRQCALARGKADAGLLDDVAKGKRQALRTEGLLENVKRDASFRDVAGLGRLREWIAKRKSAWTPEGQRFGLVPPKGILITGVQGCGRALRRARWPASGVTTWYGWMRALCTTNLWGKARSDCVKHWSWRRNYRQ